MSQVSRCFKTKLILAFFMIPQLGSLLLMGFSILVYAESGIGDNDIMVALNFVVALFLGMLLFAQLGMFWYRMAQRYHPVLFSSILVWVIFMGISSLVLLIALTQSTRPSVVHHIL